MRLSTHIDMFARLLVCQLSPVGSGLVHTRPAVAAPCSANPNIGATSKSAQNGAPLETTAFPPHAAFHRTHDSSFQFALVGSRFDEVLVPNAASIDRGHPCGVRLSLPGSMLERRPSGHRRPHDWPVRIAPVQGLASFHCCCIAGMRFAYIRYVHHRSFGRRGGMCAKHSEPVEFVLACVINGRHNRDGESATASRAIIFFAISNCPSYIPIPKACRAGSSRRPQTQGIFLLRTQSRLACDGVWQLGWSLLAHASEHLLHRFHSCVIVVTSLG
ncbi:hypothetical protein B0T26DRAFT_689761 [Lasiosphaeria miniovina]|uniref:Secreted protein n=1 Tax=Lasiosphaeria miniovina TaxID=1954250 RepID=A0AA40BIF4_9PEZI|nr:uncharacterized protein B0T26DRAFT_689761 [Lasiosphaeria miniovina]KAK0734831.1 hypothetical protein B0T26DRAFT_689761 [Lasiosphaeria miniovina]